MSDQEHITQVIRSAETIVVVGMSDDMSKAAARVPAYLIEVGYHVIAVHPRKQAVQGCVTYPSLDDIPDGTRVDLIDVFRPSEEMPGIARQALRLRPNTFWMQLGLQSDEARRLLESAGVQVIENRCTLVEHRALQV